ncbi:MAG: CHASE2 domain-containing protein, partial [Thermodesulfobacteriota bacterium]|nr:CHASE2 domain-containing protein [Thermodesulfobacteriota bacterium]
MGKIIFKKSDMIIGLIVTGLFIFFSFSSFWIFEALEGIVYGIEMRLDLPRRFSANKIAIVNIDDKSLKQLGPWPWPRHIIADMIAILKNNGAKTIGLDLVFSEKEQNQGLQEVRKLYNSITSRDEITENENWILSRLKHIEKKLDNDRILSDTVKESGNLIFPILGRFGKYETELLLTQDSFLEKNSLKSTNINLALKDIISVNQITTPFLELAKNSHGLGHLVFFPKKSMKGRVHLLFINYRGHIIPSMPLRLSSDYLDKKPEEVLIKGKEIRLTKSIISTPKGEIFIKFKGGRRSFPYYSFVDILKVKKVPAVFDNKIVLIGYTAEGATSINTPVDPKMPRVELTANIIEGLMNGRYLKRPGIMVYIELLLILFLGLSSSFILPRLKSINRFGVTIGFLSFFILMAAISFMVLDIWFKIIYMALTLVTILIVTFVRDFFVRQRSFVSMLSLDTNDLC